MLQKVFLIFCFAFIWTGCGKNKITIGNVDVLCTYRTDLGSSASAREKGMCEGSTGASYCNKGTESVSGKTAFVYYAKDCNAFPPETIYASGSTSVSNKVNSSYAYGAYGGTVSNWTDTSGKGVTEFELPDSETKAKVWSYIDTNGNGKLDSGEAKTCGDTSVEVKGNQGAKLETWTSQ